ncbi:hypothetical protein [Actinomadura harenae]|uniref:Uncharacterized protein n=1 Tax=Actinomadura harenae TaxID=2483351 RepID=A0A3M2M8W1_9ACTN|nr:hypothetical protein [Actinomadura harenae]RMI45313.1 hypothetical protein EBO15_10325 [Actinomadura harenae]
MKTIPRCALPMAAREFESLVAEVRDVLDRCGVPVHLDRDRDRLDEALWAFIHPDLVHGEEE